MRSTLGTVALVGAISFLLYSPLLVAESAQETAGVHRPDPGRPPSLDEGKGAAPCGRAGGLRFSPSSPILEPARLVSLEATDVLHYDLEIEIVPEYDGDLVTAVRVRGVSTLEVQAVEDGLDTFEVDLKSNLMVEEVSGSVETWNRDEEDLVTVRLNRVYDAGETFRVQVTYSGYPESDGYGAFSWWYRGKDLYVATLSQPYYARNWWPCKDTLDDKATMAMHVVVPPGMVAVSNGENQGFETLPDGRIRWNWAETHPMITYLASIAAGPYLRYDLEFAPQESLTTDPMPVPCYLYPDHWNFDTGSPLEEYRDACNELIDMLNTFSGLFGLYPFLDEKYGIVETGGGLGASMEHQTISSMLQVAWYSDIMAHELAHQWWGDEVTCQTWEDIWLNEGFASYSEALYREFRAGGSIEAYWDRMNERRPVNPDAQVYRTSTDTVTAIFSTNDVYNKGAWILHMLRHVMGDKPFFLALDDYRRSYRDDSVTTAEFTRSFSESFGQDLSWFIDEWVMQPGSPDYLWRYDVRRAGGRTYLLVSITQKQDARGYGLFVMPIDLYVETAEETRTVRLWNDDWREFYVVPVDGSPIVNVALDQADGVPGRNWVLGRSVTWSNQRVTAPPVLLDREIHVQPHDHSVSLHLVFSEDIGALDPDAVTLTCGPRHDPLTPQAVHYDAGTQTARVRFPMPTTGPCRCRLDAARIRANGMPLDGEMESRGGKTSLPSGDGQPGGNAVFVIPVTHT